MEGWKNSVYCEKLIKAAWSRFLSRIRWEMTFPETSQDFFLKSLLPVMLISLVIERAVNLFSNPVLTLLDPFPRFFLY